MAKKKASSAQGERSLEKQEATVKAHQLVAAEMESEAAETIGRLKALNQKLLKKEVERRQQVESLVQSKGYLEAELARSDLERGEMKSDLSRLGESVARMELERAVMADFVAVQVGGKFERLEMEMDGLKSDISDKESEIGRLSGEVREVEGLLGDEKEVLRRVSVERDELKNDLVLQIKEIGRLKEALRGLEEGKVEMEERIEELRMACNSVVGEKEELEMWIGSVTSEKDSVLRSLEEVHKLKEEVRRVVREKEVIEEERNVGMVERERLESVVCGLNDMVVNLQREEEKLRAYVAELEEKNYEGEERETAFRRDIDRLVEETMLSERKVEGLAVEKTKIEKDLGAAIEQLDEQKIEMEELVKEKNVIEEMKGRLDSEVGALRNQVAELKAVVSRLEECNLVEVGKVKSLESEVGEYRCKLEVVKSKRDEMENRVDEEKEKWVALKGVIVELENKVNESLEASRKVKAENAAIFAEKVGLESELKSLQNKVAALESALMEARNEFDSMKVKAELGDAKAELVMNMLKDTVAFCSKDEINDLDGDSHVDDEEAKVYVMELEMIKNAFKSKASKIENMKRELEFLQNSMEEARKRKGFWTVLSSATVLAAFSIAYVARGH